MLADDARTVEEDALLRQQFPQAAKYVDAYSNAKIFAPGASAAAADAASAAATAAAELLEAERRERDAAQARAAAKAAKRQRQKARQQQAAAAAAMDPAPAASLEPCPAVCPMQQGGARCPLPLALQELDLNAGSPAPQPLGRKPQLCSFGSPAAAAVPAAAPCKPAILSPAPAAVPPALSSAAAAPATPAAADDDEYVDALLGQLLGLSCGSPAKSSPAAAERPALLALPPHLAAEPSPGLGSSAQAASEEASTPAAPASCGAAATPASSIGQADGPPDDLCCPITQDLLRDPVIAADGFTYERSAITDWLERQAAQGQHACSPMTGAPLAHAQLTANRLARSLVAALGAGQR